LLKVLLNIAQKKKKRKEEEEEEETIAQRHKLT
jgi:hypothetical protein